MPVTYLSGKVKRCLVCGGRDYYNKAKIFAVLDWAHRFYGLEVIIHGAYRGVDTLAAIWADDRKVTQVPFPADWKRLFKAAGPARNRRMIDEGKPDIVIAFPGGDGTADMVKQARKAGIDVIRVDDAAVTHRIHIGRKESR